LDIGRKEDYEGAAETFRQHRSRFLGPTRAAAAEEATLPEEVVSQ
jgi:hypothetical protein